MISRPSRRALLTISGGRHVDTAVGQLYREATLSAVVTRDNRWATCGSRASALAAGPPGGGPEASPAWRWRESTALKTQYRAPTIPDGWGGPSGSPATTDRPPGAVIPETPVHPWPAGGAGFFLNLLAAASATPLYLRTGEVYAGSRARDSRVVRQSRPGSPLGQGRGKRAAASMHDAHEGLPGGTPFERLSMLLRVHPDKHVQGSLRRGGAAEGRP